MLRFGNTSLHNTPPDRDVALAQYRQRASVYDSELALFEPLRREAVARLELAPGATVLDAGCGTGLSFPLLQAAVGSSGRIVGIEQCPAMMERARRRVVEQGWSQVALVEAPVELASLSGSIDAVLFHFTHDILSRQEAIANVLRHLKPGARVVATGLQWAPAWSWPVNLFVFGAALYSVTTFEGLGQPWGHLAEQMGALDVDTTWMGGIYMASGTWKGKGRRGTSALTGRQRRPVRAEAPGVRH